MTSSELDNLHLADLHALASEHGIKDYRRLRRRDLISALQETDTDELEIVVEGKLLEEPSEPARGRRGPRRPPPDEGTRPRERGRDQAEEDEPEVGEGPTEDVRGVLELTRQRYGFLRLAGLNQGPGDVYVSAAQVRRCELRPGDEVSGPAREPHRGERHRALVHIDSVNGADPAAEEARPEFDSLPPILPEERIRPAGVETDILLRAVDLFAPLAFGQRVLVRSAPRSGRTTLLRGLARAATAADARVVILLVDERPEEATAWREALPAAEFAIATADQAPAEQLRAAELALERARRLAEAGDNAVLVCDSLSRLAFAAGNTDEVKRLFGSGRNLGGGGSLTVVATTIADAPDEGEAERAVLTTESSLVTLDRELAADGIYPAIVARECRISNEDSLRGEEELAAVRRLRSLLADLDRRAAAELLRERIEGTSSNAELLASVN